MCHRHRWRLRDGQHIEAAGIDAALSKDGRCAITGSGDPMFRQTFATVSPLSNPRWMAHTGGHHNLVLTVAVNEKRKRLVSVTDRELVYVWPLRRRRKGVLLASHGGDIRHVDPVPAGRRVLSVDGLSPYCVWDLTKVGDTDRADHHRHDVGAVAINSDGTVLSLADGGSEFCLTRH